MDEFLSPPDIEEVLLILTLQKQMPDTPNTPTAQPPPPSPHPPVICQIYRNAFVIVNFIPII
jgi:hypothetical protein